MYIPLRFHSAENAYVKQVPRRCSGFPPLFFFFLVRSLESYEAVVCATGSEPVIPQVPGIDKTIAIDALTAIDHEEKLGKRIVIIGGGLIGSETALDLAEKGHEVTLVEMLPQIMNGVATTDFLAYSERIEKTNMQIMTNTRLIAVEDHGVTVQGPHDFEKLDADTVVLAIGLRAKQELYHELKERGKEVYLVGDAVKAGKIFDAFHTAYRTALKI